jgi:hypothetical protein
LIIAAPPRKGRKQYRHFLHRNWRFTKINLLLSHSPSAFDQAGQRPLSDLLGYLHYKHAFWHQPIYVHLSA